MPNLGDYEPGGRKRNGNLPAKQEPVGRITEPRCHTCTHPQRDAIDSLLAIKTPYSTIERLFSTEERKLDYRSVSKHDKEHLDYENEAVRQILEHEAQVAGENLDLGVRGTFLRRSSLDVAIKKLFDGIISGDVEVEAKDLPKFIELREKLDRDTVNAQLETVMMQFQAFKEAILEVCPPEMQHEILVATQLKADVKAHDVMQRPALQPGQDGYAEEVTP